MVLLSSSSLVVVVAAVVVVIVRRRHDERDDYVRLETTHSAHVYYELRRREKMRPKNAAINLEPILQREREKRGKKIRAFCVTKERITVCILCVSHRRLLRASPPRKIERDGGEGGGGPVVVVFVVFCCWTPSRFSEVRSFSCVLVGCN